MANLCFVGGYPDANLRCLRGTTFNYLQIKSLAKYFDNVYVISPRLWLPRLLRYLPFVPRRVRDYAGFYDYTHKNIRVFFPKYLPWLHPQAPHLFVPYHTKLVEGVIERYQLRFDWVQAYFTVPMGATAAVVARRAGARSLVTLGENDEWLRGAVDSRNPVYLQCWRDADRVAVVNHKFADWLIEAGIPADKILYVPNGFDHTLVPDEGKAALRARLGIAPQEFVFVNVAFIEPKKDHKTLVESFRQLLANGRRARLFILGNGPLMADVARQIQEIKLTEHVRLLGSRPPKEVMEWNTAADVCVNYSKAEGNPTVMFEALGCGRPYVGSDVGGVAQVITDERLGLLAPPGDAGKLRDLLSAAMERQWDADFIRKEAAQYSWDRIAQHLHDEVFQRPTRLPAVSGAVD
jgi:glycosyltransferase involved in cell wall biosynthesis